MMEAAAARSGNGLRLSSTGGGPSPDTTTNAGLHPHVAAGWLPMSAAGQTGGLPAPPPHYLSSLSINTGSSYAFLHGSGGGGGGTAGTMPSPASSPFRAPSGLGLPPSVAAVRHHPWSHTPPPPPLDGYGRYGLGHGLYSLFPMMTSSAADVGQYCMQSSAAVAARYLHKAAVAANPYHHLLDPTRDLGLYHHPQHHHQQQQQHQHASLPLGSPYSPTLSIDPLELASPSSSSLDMERTVGTPHEYSCKGIVGSTTHDCSAGFWKRRSPSTGSVYYDNGSANKAAIVVGGGGSTGYGCYNCKTCEEAERTLAKNTEARRSTYGCDNGINRPASRPGSKHECSQEVSQKPRDVIGKTVLSPPKGTAPTTLPCSLKLVTSDVAPDFKGAMTPTLKSCEGQTTSRSAARQTTAKPKYSESQTTPHVKDSDGAVKREIRNCDDVKCNNVERPATAAVRIVNPRTSMTTTDVSGNAQIQVLNLSQSSSGSGKWVGPLTGASNSDDGLRTDKAAAAAEKLSGESEEVPKDEEIAVCDNEDNDDVLVKKERGGEEDVVTCHMPVSQTASAVPTTTVRSTQSAICSNAATFWSSISSFSSIGNVQLSPLEVTEQGFRSENSRTCFLSNSSSSSEAFHAKDSRKCGGGGNRDRKKMSPNAANSAKRIEAIVTSIAHNKMNNSNSLKTAMASSAPPPPPPPVLSHCRVTGVEFHLESKVDKFDVALRACPADEKFDEKVTKPMVKPALEDAADVGARTTKSLDACETDKGLDLTKNSIAAVDPLSAIRLESKSVVVQEKRCKATKSPKMLSPNYVSSSRPTYSPMQNVYQSQPEHLPWSWDIAAAPPSGGVVSQKAHLRPVPLLEVSGSRVVGGGGNTGSSFPFHHGLHVHSGAGKMEAPTLLHQHHHHHHHHRHFDWMQQHSVPPPIPCDLSVNSAGKALAPTLDNTQHWSSSASVATTQATTVAASASSSTAIMFSASSMSRKMSPLTISTGSPLDGPLRECGSGPGVPALLLCSSNGSSSAAGGGFGDADDSFKSKDNSSGMITSSTSSSSSSDMRSATIDRLTNSAISPKKRVGGGGTTTLPSSSGADVGPVHPLGKSTLFRVKSAKNKISSPADQIVLKQFSTGTTSSIPVGIAVARLRQESHSANSTVKQKVPKGLRKIVASDMVIGQTGGGNGGGTRCDDANEDFLRNPRQLLSHREKSGSTRHATPIDFEANVLIAGGSGSITSSSWAENSAKMDTPYQTRWLPTSTHGHGMGTTQALWLDQTPYAAAPAPLPVQLSSLENSSRQFPPLGYQLARDPITSHFFLIPTTNIGLMDSSFLWPNYASAPPTSTSATQIPPAHANHFQQFVYHQKQQEHLLQQRASDLRVKQRESRLPSVCNNKGVDDLVSSNDDGGGDVGLNLTLSEMIPIPSVKKKTSCGESTKVKTSVSSSSTVMASIPTVPSEKYDFYDHRVSSAPTDDLRLNLDADKRTKGTAAVLCSVDSCLTPPSDGKYSPSSAALDDDDDDGGDIGDSGKTPVHVDVVGLGDSDEVDSNEVEPLMTDACNQTETPPLTDDDEDEDDDDVGAADAKNTVIDGSTDSLLVKQEDSGIQCDLLSLKSCEFSSSSASSVCDFSTVADKKTLDASASIVTVTGLELLSNTITEHEESHGNSKVSEVTSVSTKDSLQEPPVVSSTEDFSTPEQQQQRQQPKPCHQSSEPRVPSVSVSAESTEVSINDETLSRESQCKPEIDVVNSSSEPQSLGGLSLLCALAEQRILQETVDPNDAVKIPSPTACDQVLIASDDDAENSNKPESSSNHNRNLKISKIQKEYKEFIAHKMLQYSLMPGVNKSLADESVGGGGGGGAGDMDAAEFEMRMRLAELQKKYKEKQKELARLLPKKDHHHLAEHGFSKRGPGRPRKRKLLALYKSNVAAAAAGFSSSMFRSLVSGGKSSRSSSSSSSSRRICGFSFKEGTVRSGKQILKPSVLLADNKSTSVSVWAWTTTTTTTSVESTSKISSLPPPPPPSFCPLTMGLLSFGKSASSVCAESLGRKTNPKAKDFIRTEAAESSSDTSDSDDSNSCNRRKRSGKRGLAIRETLSKRAKRKFVRLGRPDHDDDDGLDLSQSFSSLSVSCTMPPFQGCEESSGLGLLAKYASQVVEQAAESSGGGVGVDGGSVTVVDQLATCCTANDEGGAPEAATECHGNDDPSKICFSVSCKRKPGRPKKHSPARFEQTIVDPLNVTKKATPVSFLKLDSCISKSSKLASKDSESSRPGASKSNSNHSEAKHPSFLEDEAWMRRRSERIFLNDPSVHPKSSLFTSWNSSHDLRSSGGGHYTSLFSTWNEDDQTKSEITKPKKRPSKGKSPDTDLTVKKWKPIVSKQNKELPAAKIASDINPLKSAEQTVEEVAPVVDDGGVQKKLDDLDPESPGNSSFSEGDNLPLIKLIQRPTTPEPRSCVIRTEELTDSLRVLTMMDGLFYAGHINAIRAPDVYGITVDGERGNRPHIYSREEILKEAILEVKPSSMRYLPEGTRVCTYWSQQYRCLYPGTVSKPTSPCPSPDHNDQESVYVEFDDGDSGRIPMCNIRLLPPDLPIISYDPDPLIVGKRRRKSTGDICREKQCLTSLHELTSKSLDTQMHPSDMGSSEKEPTFAKSTPPNRTPSSSSTANPYKSVKSKVSNSSTMISLEGTKSKIDADKTLVIFPSVSVTKTTITTCSTPNESIKFRTLKPIRETSLKNNITMTSLLRIPDKCCPSPLSTLASVIAASTTSTTTITCTSSPSTSITVIAIGDAPNANLSGAAGAVPAEEGGDGSSPLSKWKKHKKHRDHDRIDDRRHHHHHHHHHHRRKHRHDRLAADTFRMPMTKVTPEVSTAATVTAEAETKKPELTLKIKTGSHPAADLDCPESGGGVVSVCGTGSGRAAEDRDSSSLSSCSGSSSDELGEVPEINPELQPPPSKKMKTAKEESGANIATVVNCQKNAPKANKKGKDKAATVESKSKMAAFLPARQLWKWSGKGFRRPSKGKARKEFYKSITRGKELIRVGDSAVFLSTGRPHLPYIGRIETMWESWGGNMVVKVKWFYHPEETKGGRRLVDTKGALYQSLHEDENDVQTISHKCEVLSWSEYSEYKLRESSGTQHVSKYGGSPFDNNDVYYLAGTYDPLTGHVTLEPGVS